MRSLRSAPVLQRVVCLDVAGTVVCPPLSYAQQCADREGRLVRAVTRGTRRPVATADRLAFVATARGRLTPVSYAERQAEASYQRVRLGLTRRATPAPLSLEDGAAWRQIGAACVGRARVHWERLTEVYRLGGLPLMRAEDGAWIAAARRAYMRQHGSSGAARTIDLEAQRTKRPKVKLANGRTVALMAPLGAMAPEINRAIFSALRSGDQRALLEALWNVTPELTIEDVASLTPEDVQTLWALSEGRLTEEAIAAERQGSSALHGANGAADSFAPVILGGCR